MSDIETPGAGETAPPPAPITPPEPPAEPAPEPFAEPRGSLPGNLYGVLFSPGPTFRRILSRPTWVGALVVYLAAVVVSITVYSLKVDWEGMFRGQFESSLAWKLMSSVMNEDQLGQTEKAAIDSITSTGRGGMALQTVTQSVIYGTLAVHGMAILFATLFYLMGTLTDVKLGRLYLDGFMVLLLLIAVTVISGLARGLTGSDVREFLPVQAGLSTVFAVVYAWLLYKTVERQQGFKRLFSVYAHAMVVPALAALIAVIVMLLHHGPIVEGGDEILKSNLGAILGVHGTGVLATLLSALGIFRLWELAVASIGFAAVSRLSIGTSVAITFLPWGFVTMARVALAAVFGG